MLQKPGFNDLWQANINRSFSLDRVIRKVEDRGWHLWWVVRMAVRHRGDFHSPVLTRSRQHDDGVLANFTLTKPL